MKEHLKRIGDVFNIERRLKEIDAGYVIYYNTLKGRYEVHNENNKGDSLALVSPYGEVDARLITLVRRTRVERAHELYQEMEEENERIITKQAQDEAEERKAKAKAVLVEMKKKLNG